MANKHTLSDLYQMQSLPLSAKISMTEYRIREWINEFGEDGCYVSFSGGKDSTVLLDIVRNRMGYKNVEAVFVDIPTQYPELKEFAESFENVTVIKPKMSFAKVIEEYGFPLISKEVSESVEGARKYLTQILAEQSITEASKQASKQAISISTKRFLEQADMQSLLKMSGVGTITSIENSEELANLLNQKMQGRTGGNNQRLAIMLGMLTKDQKIKANIPSEDRSQFSQERYKFFLDAPFEISNRCCKALKKEPLHSFYRKNHKTPITAQMAAESKLRTQKWLQNGCNGFKLKIPTSNPMSFWTEQDILLYIKLYNIPICSVYGDVVKDYDGMDQLEGQISIGELLGSDEKEIFDLDRPLLKTTGCDRTGCVLCGFGCHLRKENERFLRLKETHPKFHNLLYILKNNGVTYAEAIDWINEHGGFNIKY